MEDAKVAMTKCEFENIRDFINDPANADLIPLRT